MSKKGWPLVKFGDVVEYARRNVKDRKEAGIDRILGLDDIETRNLHVTGWKDVESNPSFRTHFKPGQTLFGKRRAYLRKVAYAEFEGVCTQNIMVFETKDSEVLLPELLPFICMNEPFMQHAIKHSTGSLFPNANWNAIKEYEFILPPINEQKKFSELLWACDKLMQSSEQAIEKLLQFKSKLSSIEFHSLSESNEVQLLPMSKICDLIVDCPHTTPKWTESGKIVVRNYNLSDGEIDLSKPSFCSDEDFIERTKRARPKSGDIIFSREAPAGVAGLVPDSVELCLGQRIMLLRPSNTVNSKFLIEYLHSSLCQRKFKSLSSGSTVMKVNVKDVRELIVPLPSLKTQNSLVSRLSIISATIKEKNNYLSATKKMMLSVIGTLFGVE